MQEPKGVPGGRGGAEVQYAPPTISWGKSQVLTLLLLAADLFLSHPREELTEELIHLVV